MINKDLKKEIKRLKKEIKDLKANKLRLPRGKERLELHHKIKELKLTLAEKKEQLKGLTMVDLDKEKLITEILKYESISIFDQKYYEKFTKEQLKKHLENLKRKEGEK